MNSEVLDVTISTFIDNISYLIHSMKESCYTLLYISMHFYCYYFLFCFLIFYFIYDFVIFNIWTSLKLCYKYLSFSYFLDNSKIHYIIIFFKIYSRYNKIDG